MYQLISYCNNTLKDDVLNIVDPLVAEQNESAGHNSSHRTQSPSDMSKSSIQEPSSQQSSSDSSSSEDEGTAGGHRKISSEWQEHSMSQHKRRKKSS